MITEEEILIGLKVIIANRVKGHSWSIDFDDITMTGTLHGPGGSKPFAERISMQPQEKKSSSLGMDDDDEHADYSKVGHT